MSENKVFSRVGILVKYPDVFEKIQTGDEFWFTQGSLPEGRKGFIWVFFVRDGHGLPMAIRNDECSGCFTLEGDLSQFLWIFQVIIGFSSGRETIIDLDPPALTERYINDVPGGKLSAILKIGEGRI